ncbi:hypothetical protein [Novipirellula caenicola]|uniref:Uncharacterized protein n=1 Tax=Novipirellula caenicola TaxID=1536901 RepID=A0ABP9VKG1_9BACT
MNTRFMSVIAAMTLLVVSSGCGTLRQFWFGRGARCGLCNRAQSIVPGNLSVMPQPAPCTQTPWVPVAPQPQVPLAVAPTPGCECNTYAGPELGCGSEVAAKCPACNSVSSGYGSSLDQYGNAVNDPYLQGEIVGSSIYDNGTIYGNSGNIISDDFDARGDRIISRDPLPPGAVPAN